MTGTDSSIRVSPATPGTFTPAIRVDYVFLSGGAETGDSINRYAIHFEWAIGALHATHTPQTFINVIYFG